VKITLLGDDGLRVEDSAGVLTIEAPGAGQQYGPFHMLASGLASCTFSVLRSWAVHAGVDPSPLAVEVRWTFAEEPHRVGSMAVTLLWPGLPPHRQPAAKRAAVLCAVHKTLEQPPALTIEMGQ
jgi:putative redox protein